MFESAADKRKYSFFSPRGAPGCGTPRDAATDKHGFASVNMSQMTRHLLGGKEITHDPGPEGDSGEGDAALVMVFLVISLAGGILIYGASLSSRAASHPTQIRFESPSISVGSCASSRARRSLCTAPIRVRYERRHAIVRS